MCARLRFRCAKSLMLACCAFATSSTAQTPPLPVPVGPLALEHVLDLAEGRSESIAIATVGRLRADGEQVRARSGLLPQLSASVGYDRALASEFSGVFDTTTDEGLGDLPFGQSNTWRATLSFSQNLYSGGRLGAQKALAQVGRDSADLSVTTARAQLLFDVTQAYYDAALSERLVAIAAATLEQAGATLRQTQAGFDAGTQPEFEVLRARVTRDNQTPLLIRQRVNREIAMQRLKQFLDLPSGYDLRLADALGDDVLAPPPVFAERVASVESLMRSVEPTSLTLQENITLPDRTAVAEAGATVRLREASLRLTEAGRMPSVTLNSSLSRIAYPSGFFPTFDRTNWTIGAAVNLPILTGGRQRGDEIVARAELEQARVQRQQVEELAALDTRSAWAELLAARTTWVASAGTIQQATRAYEIADVRYRAGVSTQLELSDSRLALQQAEANRVQAARDLHVARARVALLPGLPVGAGGAAPRTPVPLPTPSAPQPQGGGGQLTNAVAQPGQTQAGTR